jgi:hypothetical protein
MRASSDDTAGGGRISSGARRPAQSILTFLTPRKQKRFSNAPVCHGRMRDCEGTSKAAMKAKRAHAEI